MRRTEVSLEAEPNSSAQDTCFSPWLARLRVCLYFTPSASPNEAGRLLDRGPEGAGEDSELAGASMEGRNIAPCHNFDFDFFPGFSGLSGESTNDNAAAKVGLEDDDDDDEAGDVDGSEEDDDEVLDAEHENVDGADGDDGKGGGGERVCFLEESTGCDFDDIAGSDGEGERDSLGTSTGSGVTIAF
ncbi:hypothetical protein ElyMa_006243100 [Elysia marginata]|uniref:Uncharacterized protein n=1 Tax=Elysia marginata TaxID=1093978 RepID=A0AAV4HAQ1_9GAST|nr:hypothetical protein ElyMa_006243100 [Elysia marginata]